MYVRVGVCVCGECLGNKGAQRFRRIPLSWRVMLLIQFLTRSRNPMELFLHPL